MRKISYCFFFLMVVTLAGNTALAADKCYVKKDSWFETMVASLNAAAKTQASQKAPATVGPLPLFKSSNNSLSLWIKPSNNGSPALVSLAEPNKSWARGGKTLFVRRHKLAFDVGFVGALESAGTVKPHQWQHVALVQKNQGQILYLNGKQVSSQKRALELPPTPAAMQYVLGACSQNFAGENFVGTMDELRIFSVALSAEQVAKLAKGEAVAGGEVASWCFDGNDPPLNYGGCTLGKGKNGQGLEFNGKNYATLLVTGESNDIVELLARAGKDFGDATTQQQIAWEKKDTVWEGVTPKNAVTTLAAKYADLSGDARAAALAKKIAGADQLGDLIKVRGYYIAAKERQAMDKVLKGSGLPAMRGLVNTIAKVAGPSYPLEKHLKEIDALGKMVVDGKTEGFQERLKKLKYEALLRDNPKVDFDKMAFIKRNSYNGNHYYTEFINGQFRPGGNICILDFKSGEVTDVVKEITNADFPDDVKKLTPSSGIFRAFDLSYDGKKMVFAWKAEAMEGYRIYECDLDGGNLRQLTFRPENEDILHERYTIANYHHGTDDMDPCYLPSDEICFISTRCNYGILCDNPDIFTTTILHKMDKDGKNMQPLSNSSVSEAMPSVANDGRILYTRWEYFDKGSSCVKCIWSMKTDGSGSAEVYGNNIALPATMLNCRSIPGAANEYVMLGSPHCCPWVGLGTVIRLDMTKNIRTNEPMTLMSPNVDVQGLGGEARLKYRDEKGDWQMNTKGPMYRDPYPLSRELFLVSYKPMGPDWSDAKGWAIAMLDEKGNTVEIYRDDSIACWYPFPLKPRKKPQVTTSPVNTELAKKELATAMVTDVYHGMDDVARGSVKYLRIIEQIPRPWESRRRWGGDSGWGQQHVANTASTHLGLKTQRGVVPVEKDGSANFYVPAMRNISLQALDANYRSIQTERTYVNYIAGEQRSCVGCHETPHDAASALTQSKGTPLAMRRPPSTPAPQPGDKAANKVLDYRDYVQPVLNKHCIKCHNTKDKKGGLVLTDGFADRIFTESYKNLLDKKVCGLINNEVRPKTGNAEYRPPYTFGSYSSVLAQIISPDDIRPDDERALKLRDAHKERFTMPLADRVQLYNWIDTNCQFYGSYWGRRNEQYKDHPNFRPVSKFDEVLMRTCPTPWEER